MKKNNFTNIKTKFQYIIYILIKYVSKLSNNVSTKDSFGKKSLKRFIGYKNGKNLDLYVYCVQIWAHIEGILIKLNIFLIW